MTRSEPAPVAVAPTVETRTGRSAWLVLAAVLPGMFMNVFDFFAVNVATPVLHRELGSGPPALELIVGGYGLTFSLGLVTGGGGRGRHGGRPGVFPSMAAAATPPRSPSAWCRGGGPATGRGAAVSSSPEWRRSRWPRPRAASRRRAT